MAEEKDETMEKRIAELLFNIGLDKNTLQVLGGDSVASTLMFPNFMEQTNVLNCISDKELMDTIQKLMEEHAMDVAKAIKMFMRYRKSYE